MLRTLVMAALLCASSAAFADDFERPPSFSA